MDVSAAIGLLATPAGRRDPYPAYEALRAYGPAVGIGGQVIVTAYEYADAVLRDPSMRVVDRAMLLRRFGPAYADRPAQRLLTDSVLNTNAPDHRAMRQVMAAAFTPRLRNSADVAVVKIPLPAGRALYGDAPLRPPPTHGGHRTADAFRELPNSTQAAHSKQL
jgi:hypothetical protein